MLHIHHTHTHKTYKSFQTHTCSSFVTLNVQPKKKQKNPQQQQEFHHKCGFYLMS